MAFTTEINNEILTTKMCDSCIFCKRDKDIICENEYALAFYDSYPVSKGHVLIIPKRHIETYFDLSEEEMVSFFKLSKEVKRIIDEKYSPDGYNVGFNIGEYGGQSVMHCHMHIIPRYKGDVENPRGGIRGVIPNKKNY